MPTKDLEQKIQECIDACSNCYKSCVVTMQHSFSMAEKGDKITDRSHINILKDCAEISKITETFLLHSSEFSHDAAELCAKICDRCAQDCLAVGSDDSQMQGCAEFCKKCANSCREI